ncbi:MAG: cytochrome c oxidase subunit I [Dehalococcoidia bacterium]|nr:cytochrome c oxidase subunit I [Dehalococcoidia bacterium]
MAVAARRRSRVVSIAEAVAEARRSASRGGIWGWIGTVDHKRIGILYGITALVFFLIGGIEALIFRIQLARPDQSLLTPEQYNTLFTMHGTTMIFLVIMPLSLAVFANYLVPLMIGARDMAFPRLNAFSYWVFLFGGLFLYASFFTTGTGFLSGKLGAPDTGWYGYAPLTESAYTPGVRDDFWALGLQILGISTLAGSFNLIVTILNMRAPGMTMFRMPAFVWMVLVTAFLAIFALVILGAALWFLTFDRLYGANFFNPAAGGQPLLWQHMFWLFGHPEVYILILPSMGIVSDVLPTFARKPLFGYPFVIFSGIAIGFISWGVWGHHMFTTGLGSAANSAFGVSTIIIAVPTGVKIFNWLATLWGGKLQMKTALYFAIGFIAMFTIGGLTGVTHSAVPSDYQQNDTYYVVAHFHQVLFGGSAFAFFAATYYWFPKITGRMLHDGWGKVHFWLTLIGFNVTFQPMMVLGILGMPRRINTYPAGLGWGLWNMVATVGAFIIALGALVFVINIIVSLKRGEEAGADPWDGRTLEWATSSPPPKYNFAVIPIVHARDDFWHRKYVQDPDGRPVPIPAGGAVDTSPEDDDTVGHRQIHLPSPSFFPIIAALGLPVMASGFIYHPALLPVGALLTLVGIFAWAVEPVAESEVHTS